MPFNLKSLRQHLANVSFARRALPDDVAARQKLLEESVYDNAQERLQNEEEMLKKLGLDTGVLRRSDLQRWMFEWHTQLQERLKEEIRNIEILEREKSDIWTHLSPYLSLVKPERLSLITIFEIMRLQSSGGVSEGMKTTRALIAVGKAVENEYKAQVCKKNNISFPTIGRVGDNGYFSNLGYNSLLERRIVAARHMTDGEAWTATWTQGTRAKVGSILVECLMDVAKVTRSAVHKVTKEVMYVSFPVVSSSSHNRLQHRNSTCFSPYIRA